MRWPYFRRAGWLALALGVSVRAATYEVAQRDPQASDDGAACKGLATKLKLAVEHQEPRLDDDRRNQKQEHIA